MKKIGEILKNGEIEKAANSEGYVYIDEEAFNLKEGVCYVPEHGPDNINEDKASIYTYYDFIDLAGGNPEMAERIFYSLDWQHPETYVNNREGEGLIYCSNCGWLIDMEEEKCPNCKTVDYE